jgi:hypothetical protein
VPSTGEYKVLTIVNKTRWWGERYQVGMVLTLGSNGGGQWSEVAGPPAIVRRRHCDVAVVKGVAFFSVKSYLHGDEPEAHIIVEFDLDTEEWLPLPFTDPPARQDGDHPPFEHCDTSLAEVNDFLVLAHHHRDRASAMRLRLWFLMGSIETTRMWYPLYTIAMPDHGSSRFRFEKPLQVLGDGRIVVWSSTTDGSHDGMPQIYDPKTETFTEGAVTQNCYAVGSWTGCLLRLGSSDRRSQKTLELLVEEAETESPIWHALRTVEYGSEAQALVVQSSATSVY